MFSLALKYVIDTAHQALTTGAENMYIKAITSQHRNDFSATMKCEHCGHTQTLTSGYHDDFYHERVIPAMTCGGCGLNRAGEAPAIKNDSGMAHVAA